MRPSPNGPDVAIRPPVRNPTGPREAGPGQASPARRKRASSAAAGAAARRGRHAAVPPGRTAGGGTMSIEEARRAAPARRGARGPAGGRAAHGRAMADDRAGEPRRRARILRLHRLRRLRPLHRAAFFPTADPLVGQVLAFSVFAGGYLARPFGGMLMGALGDRFGRRRVFLSSLGAISGSTVLMGLLPGYAAWGVGAPVAHGGAAARPGPVPRRRTALRHRLRGRDRAARAAASPAGCCSSSSTRASASPP